MWQGLLNLKKALDRETTIYFLFILCLEFFSSLVEKENDIRGSKLQEQQLQLHI